MGGVFFPVSKLRLFNPLFYNILVLTKEKVDIMKENYNITKENGDTTLIILIVVSTIYTELRRTQTFDVIDSLIG